MECHRTKPTQLFEPVMIMRRRPPYAWYSFLLFSGVYLVHAPKEMLPSMLQGVLSAQASVDCAKASCDPNYAGACVPIANDVDSAGGKGNGPPYVSGIVEVIGSDFYNFDGDGDGRGCEPR